MGKEFNYVYLTINLLNGKQYVGSHSTNNIDDGYLGTGRYFFRAVKKEGKENFKKEILQMCENIIEARKLEESYIIKYNTLSPNGYNLSPTGGCERGFSGALSEEHKRKISVWQKGKTYVELYGPEKAAQMKEKQNIKKLGSTIKKASQERKDKISAWQKGKTYVELYGPEKATQMKEKQKQRKLGTTSKRKGKKYIEGFINKYGEKEGLKKYEEFIKKQREAHIGKIQTKETIEKRKQSMRDPWNKGKKYHMKNWVPKIKILKITKLEKLLNNETLVKEIINLRKKNMSYRKIFIKTGVSKYYSKKILLYGAY